MHNSLKILIDGNKRFAEGKSIHPNLSQELRNTLQSTQKPFAAIIACSDSRVPVEIIFDVGLGDLFVIRSAGHVLSKEAIGSVEYAVKALGVKFVMVLGHDNCGAVVSALNTYKTKEKEELPQNLQILLSHIYPVFDELKEENMISLDEAIKINIEHQVDKLKNDSYLSQKVKADELLIVGAKYSFDTGLIEVFE